MKKANHWLAVLERRLLWESSGRAGTVSRKPWTSTESCSHPADKETNDIVVFFESMTIGITYSLFSHEWALSSVWKRGTTNVRNSKFRRLHVCCGCGVWRQHWWRWMSAAWNHSPDNGSTDTVFTEISTISNNERVQYQNMRPDLGRFARRVFRWSNARLVLKKKS